MLCNSVSYAQVGLHRAEHVNVHVVHKETLTLQDKPDAPDGSDLLLQPLCIVNIGLPSFAVELQDHGVDVVDVAWTPPAGGDPELADLLSRLGG